MLKQTEPEFRPRVSHVTNPERWLHRAAVTTSQRYYWTDEWYDLVGREGPHVQPISAVVFMVDEADGPIGKVYKRRIAAGTLLPVDTAPNSR